MKLSLAHIEQYRVTAGPLGSDASYGRNGKFLIPGPKGRGRLTVVVSDGGGWEHVSVSPYLQKRTPTWEEMSHIKDLFWEPEEVAMQIHPRRSEYVNFHPYALHMWRPTASEIPAPPSIYVGPRGGKWGQATEVAG